MILKKGKRTPLMLQCLHIHIYTYMYPSGLVVPGHVVHLITYNLRTLKPLTVWIITNCGKFLKTWKYQTTLPASWEICMQVKKHQLELDMEQWAGSKLGKVYIKAAVTICSDFGAPQNKVSHCFHCFLIYLPWSDGTGCHNLSFLNVEF